MAITKGFSHIIDEKELDALLASGKPLRVKAGFDPTSPDLHLGHAVLLKKLRNFQDAGHTVVMIVGTTTASIGDPTGRSKARPPLSRTQIEDNATTYMSQAYKILDRERTVVRENGDWFDDMKVPDFLRILSEFTLSQMETRDELRDRKSTCTPIFLNELVYPVLQAYDSVREGVDIELGGNDQFYNLMVGRDFMHSRGMKPQVIATVPLLLGTDGVQKMSKSLGNHIGLTDAPFDMFSKIMSISDELMYNWLAVLFPEDAFAISLELDKPNYNPKDMKLELAYKIAGWLHGADAAQQAGFEWARIFSQREKPSEISTVVVPVLNHDTIYRRLDRIITLAGLASSTTEANRLIKGGAVTVNGIKMTKPLLDVPFENNSEVKVGRKWLKIVQG